jgi:AraC-like DNA-binding protein
MRSLFVSKRALALQFSEGRSSGEEYLREQSQTKRQRFESDTNFRSATVRTTSPSSVEAPSFEVPELVDQEPTIQQSLFAEVLQIMDQIRFAVERRPEDARVAAQRLLALLMESAVAEPTHSRGGLAPWRKKRVRHYLQEHLTRPLHADELASQASLSLSYFHRAFKDSFRETPMAYVTRLRLELAQAMMLDTGSADANCARAESAQVASYPAAAK